MKKYIMVSFRTGWDWKFNFIHPFKVIRHYYQQVKYFIQRGLYGYADDSVWNIDYYLCEWLPSAIREQKEDSWPPPSVKTKEEWEEILEKIALGFESNLKLLEMMSNEEEKKTLEEQSKDGLELFIKYFNNLWN